MDCTATPDIGAKRARRGSIEDFSAIVIELITVHGLSQPQIATECDCSQSAVSDIARGVTKDPRHSIGEALKRLLATKRGEAAQKAASAAAPADRAGTERRDPARAHEFSDLDRRAAAGG
jgi:predicted XRE-type DNA-binding protein